MQKTLDENQPPEQAGFRKSFSTTDHVQVMNELIERAVEYNFPLYIAFIDYSKAFDSIEHGALWNALNRQGVPAKMIRVLQLIYNTTKIYVRRSGS